MVAKSYTEEPQRHGVDGHESAEHGRSLAGLRTNLPGAAGEIPLRWCYVARAAAMTLLRS